MLGGATPFLQRLEMRIGSSGIDEEMDFGMLYYGMEDDSTNPLPACMVPRRQNKAEVAGKLRSKANAIMRKELFRCTHSHCCLMWKCKACCRIATATCFSDTNRPAHLCDTCIKSQSTSNPVTQRTEFEQCDGTCGLTQSHPSHPQPGVEYCLGCQACFCEGKPLCTRHTEPVLQVAE